MSWDSETAGVRVKVIKKHIPDKQFKFEHVCRKLIPCSACRDYPACHQRLPEESQ